MKRYPKILLLFALFFIFYVPLFFAFFQCYCLSDADFFGSPQFEAPDLLSEPSPSLSDSKFVLFIGNYDSSFILDTNIFDHLPVIAFQILQLDPTTPVLRC